MNIPKLVILDRDGVINEDSDNYIKSPQEWIPIPDSLKAIAHLNKLGCKIAVATNQSGIYRGYYDENTLHAMHEKMHQLLAEEGGHIDFIRYCPHGADDGCTCRKPAAGMLLDALKHFNISANEAVFVGDTLSDYKAAQNAGIAFVMVKTGKGTRVINANNQQDLPDIIFESLSHYVSALPLKGQTH